MSLIDWSIEEYSMELAVAATKLHEIADREPTRADIETAIQHFPLQHRLTAFTCLSSMQDRVRLRMYGMQLEAKREEQAQIERREIRAFWTGVAALLLDLIASAFLKDKDPSTILILRVIAGLGVGLAIAFIPGFFSIDTTIEQPGVRVAFRATGALAAVVMIYLFDPGWVSHLMH